MQYLLHHTIHNAAQSVPDRNAFRTPNQSVTYGDFEIRTNQLARRLIACGVRAGDRVGIFMPRTLETAIAVHGILKAGAAFVPMDPQSPLQRLDSIVHHCGLRHLVTSPSMRNKIQRLCELKPRGLQHIVGIDGDHESVDFHTWQEVFSESGEPAPSPEPSEHDLAYIMYTSGSTGAPKGIMHTHRSGLSYARLSAKTYNLCPDDCIGNHSPLHFDMSTFGYLTSPYARASTVIVPDAHTKMPVSLAQLVATEAVTVWYSVPLALNQMLNSRVLATLDFSRLRWVLFGGEPIAPKTLRQLMHLWPNARFSNVYGPAEVNQCTYFHLPEHSGGSDWPDEESIPLGQIWDETDGLVLDTTNRPVAAGETGELVVKTPTMMAGYWNRPDLNSNAFYRRIHPDGSPEVYYRTGDLVRTDPEGRLIFVGRRDRQVKIRGHRVELDEIEAALASHPSVSEAGVFKLSGRDGDSFIGAACTLLPGHAATGDELRKFLSLRTAPYAVPATIEVREDLPRTGTGKVDRVHLAREVAPHHDETGPARRRSDHREDTIASA